KKPTATRLIIRRRLSLAGGRPVNCYPAPEDRTSMRTESGITGRDFYQWTPIGRGIVFFLAATSIWCLLAEFYGLCSMRTFTFAILLPATLLLIVLAVLNRGRGDGELWRAVLIGTAAGFLAACAYDMFRLPFAYAQEWSLAPAVP